MPFDEKGNYFTYSIIEYRRLKITLPKNKTKEEKGISNQCLKAYQYFIKKFLAIFTCQIKKWL